MSRGQARPNIIAFIGTVGAGKSTQMRFLASELRTRGLKVKPFFLKTGHLFAYLLEVTLARMLVGKKGVPPIRGLIEEKPNLFRRLFKLWLTLDVISVSIKFLLGIYIPVNAGYIVLVEDYIPATLADYMYLSEAIGLPLRTSSFTLNFMLRLLHLGSPTQVIFLDAHANGLKPRWSRGGNQDERLDYLRMQRTMLLSLSKKLSSDDLLYIDTSKQTIEETHKLITDHLMKFWTTNQ